MSLFDKFTRKLGNEIQRANKRISGFAGDLTHPWIRLANEALTELAPRLRIDAGIDARAELLMPSDFSLDVNFGLQRKSAAPLERDQIGDLTGGIGKMLAVDAAAFHRAEERLRLLADQLRYGSYPDTERDRYELRVRMCPRDSFETTFIVEATTPTASGTTITEFFIEANKSDIDAAHRMVREARPHSGSAPSLSDPEAGRLISITGSSALDLEAGKAHAVKVEVRAQAGNVFVQHVQTLDIEVVRHGAYSEEVMASLHYSYSPQLDNLDSISTTFVVDMSDYRSTQGLGSEAVDTMDNKTAGMRALAQNADDTVATVAASQRHNNDTSIESIIAQLANSKLKVEDAIKSLIMQMRKVTHQGVADDFRLRFRAEIKNTTPKRQLVRLVFSRAGENVVLGDISLDLPPFSTYFCALLSKIGVSNNIVLTRPAECNSKFNSTQLQLVASYEDLEVVKWSRILPAVADATIGCGWVVREGHGFVQEPEPE